MSEPIDPQSAVDYMLKAAPRYARAKAKRVQLEEFRKSKKALLMRECTEKTLGEREAYAYAHPEYIAVVDGLQVAWEAEITLQWKLKAAELQVDIWRSQEASNRAVDRTTR